MPNKGRIYINLGRHAVVTIAIIIRGAGSTLPGNGWFGIVARRRAILAAAIIARRTYGTFPYDGCGGLRPGNEQTEQ